MKFIIAVFESKFPRDVHNNASSISLISFAFVIGPYIDNIYSDCPGVIPPLRFRDEICTQRARENKPILDNFSLLLFVGDQGLIVRKSTLNLNC